MWFKSGQKNNDIKEHTRTIGLYVIREKGVKMMRIIGEREGKKEHDGGT